METRKHASDRHHLLWELLWICFNAVDNGRGLYGLCHQQNLRFWGNGPICHTGFSHNAEENFTDARLWTWDLTLAVVGRCYTLNHDHLLQLNPLTDGILLQLVQKKDYYIYFSEPDFHFIRAWPLLTIPVTMVALHGFESNYLSVTLKMVRTEELNRPEAPWKINLYLSCSDVEKTFAWCKNLSLNTKN